MFDDQPPAQPAVPHNLPVQPDDMFSAVDADETTPPPIVEKIPDALSSGLLKKKQAPGSSSAMTATEVHIDYPAKAPFLGTVIRVVLLLLVAGAAGFVGWWAYMKYFSKTNTAQNSVTNTNTQIVPTTNGGGNNVFLPVATDTKATQPSASETTSTGSVPPKNANDALLFGFATSTSVSTTGSVSSTTSIQPDTDKDGLGDVDEAARYKTNPLKGDTDADGLTDGDEVLIWRTDPLKADTDSDSHPDGTEVANGYNPLGPGKLDAASTTSGGQKK